MEKKEKVDTCHALKITIQGVQGAGKTFVQQKIANYLNAYGYEVSISENGMIPGATLERGQLPFNGRKVLLDTSLEPIEYKCARCGAEAVYVIRKKYDFNKLYACKKCTQVDKLFSGDVIEQSLEGK
jgi:signal recognition particle GTPase